MIFEESISVSAWITKFQKIDRWPIHGFFNWDQIPIRDRLSQVFTKNFLGRGSKIRYPDKKPPLIPFFYSKYTEISQNFKDCLINVCIVRARPYVRGFWRVGACIFSAWWCAHAARLGPSLPFYHMHQTSLFPFYTTYYTNKKDLYRKNDINLLNYDWEVIYKRELRRMIEDSSSDEEDEFHNRNVHIFLLFKLKSLNIP